MRTQSKSWTILNLAVLLSASLALADDDTGALAGAYDLTPTAQPQAQALLSEVLADPSNIYAKTFESQESSLLAEGYQRFELIHYSVEAAQPEADPYKSRIFYIGLSNSITDPPAAPGGSSDGSTSVWLYLKGVGDLDAQGFIIHPHVSGIESGRYKTPNGGPPGGSLSGGG